VQGDTTGIPSSPSTGRSRTWLEKALLGSLLIDPQAIHEVAGIVNPTDFRGPKGRAIYQAILNVHARGWPVDFVLVSLELAESGALDRIGTADLAGLASHVCSSLHAVAYARALAGKRSRSVSRAVIEG
jgi:replicative DNA helicase